MECLAAADSSSHQHPSLRRRASAHPTKKRVIIVTNEAFNYAKKMIIPGAKLRDIDIYVCEFLTQKGYGAFIRHGSGLAHGIMIGLAGREEKGEIRIYNQNIFSKNMVTSVEPGIYIPELGGFRHKDVMLVTEGGAICLTECMIGLSN